MLETILETLMNNLKNPIHAFGFGVIAGILCIIISEGIIQLINKANNKFNP